MRLLKILKSSFAPILKRLGFSSLALSLTLSLLNAAPTLALETRIIDIVSIDWNRSLPLSGSVSDAQKEIENSPLYEQDRYARCISSAAPEFIVRLSHRTVTKAP